MTAPPPDRRRAAFGAASAAALVALAAAALGLPLAAPGLAEEWSVRWAFERGEPWIAPDVLSTMPTRPLASVPHALGWAMTPDSFVGDKVVLLALLAGTALAAAALLARLVPDPVAAAAGAALATLAPADTSLFNTRDLPHHAAVALSLLAILLLARAAERPSPPRLAAMAVAAGGALLVYESPLLVLLAAPALVPLLTDERRAPRAVLAVWYAVLAAFLVRAAAIAARGGDYTAQLFAAGVETPGERLVATLGAALRMAVAELSAPFRAGAGAFGALSARDLAAVAAAAGAALLLALGRASARSEAGRARHVFFAGLIFLVLGVLPFAVVPDLRGLDRRVHLMGSVGAAVALAAALAGVRPRALRAGVLGVLVAGAVAAGRVRNAETARYGARVSRLVRALAEEAPSPPSGSLLLLLDADGPPKDENVLGLTVTDVHLADALRVVHGHGDFHVLVGGRRLLQPWAGVPEPGPSGVTLRGPAGVLGVVPWEKVAVFRENAAGTVKRVDEGDAGRAVPRTGPRPPRLDALCPSLSERPSRGPSRPSASAGGPAG